MQALIWDMGFPYKCLHSSILSDLMKTTAVVESLSTIQPDVLFQRLPAYFKMQSTEWEIYIECVVQFFATSCSGIQYWCWGAYIYPIFVSIWNVCSIYDWNVLNIYIFYKKGQHCSIFQLVYMQKHYLDFSLW